MMNVLLFLILTHYAVKCADTSNYFIVEMPEDDPPRLKKPFQVYWNVPTMQCKSKKIPFDLTPYGIIQNKDDRFRGESIAILYDPGLFPALLKNDSTGKFKLRNGGVPQEGDIKPHLEAFRTSMKESIPDEDFSGVGIIDFESWRPVLRQNFGILMPYKDVSNEIEKKKHPWWLKEWIQLEAKQRFEAAGRSFMQTTLSIAKQMRPKALWGYYGFPYCFNMSPNNMVEDCSSTVRKENDNTYWLWSESTALYPSVYSYRNLTSSQLAAMIRGRVREASRARWKSSQVIPYFWFRYRDGGYMNEVDLYTALKALYNSDTSGIIIWGSSDDVNTVEKCMNLRNYVEQTLGPAIAKYTKRTIREDESIVVTETVDSNKTTVTPNAVTNISNINKPNASVDNITVVNTQFIPIDPKFPWKPDANYSEEISHYVDTELAKKGEYNKSKDNRLDDKLFTSFNESLLMDIIINSLLHRKDTDQPVILENIASNSTFESEGQNSTVTIENTTMFNFTSDINVPTTSNKYVLETTTIQYSLETKHPYIDRVSTKNPLDNIKSINKTEAPTEANISSDDITESAKDFQGTVYTTTESDIYTNTKTENYDEFTKEFIDEMDLFYSNETLFDPQDKVLTTDITTEYLTKVDEITELFTTTTLTDADKNEGFLDSSYKNSIDTIENTTVFNFTSDINVPTTSNKYVLETTTIQYSLETEHPYIDRVSTKNLLDNFKSITKTEAPTEANISSDDITESVKDFQETVYTKTESDIYTNTKTENYDEFTKEFIDEMDLFYNNETLLDPQHKVLTTDITTEYLTKVDEITELSTTTSLRDADKNEGFLDSSYKNSIDTIENTTVFNFTSDINVPTTSNKYVLETTTIQYSLETEHPYIDRVSTKNLLDNFKSITKTEAPTEANISSDDITESAKDFQETVYTKTESDIYTNTKTENYDEFTKEFIDEMDLFYNNETLLDPQHKVLTTDITTVYLTNVDEITELSTTTTLTDADKNEGFLDSSYTLLNKNIQDELITVTAEKDLLYTTEKTEYSEITTDFGSTELITESTNLLKKLRKESTAHRETDTNFTNPSSERSPELEQVVIYVS